MLIQIILMSVPDTVQRAMPGSSLISLMHVHTGLVKR